MMILTSPSELAANTKSIKKTSRENAQILKRSPQNAIAVLKEFTS
jgi:hypothetical protein